MGHVFMENRNGLAVEASLTHADCTSERESTLVMLDRRKGKHRITLGADKAYDVTDFVGDLRRRKVAPTSLSRHGTTIGPRPQNRNRRFTGFEDCVCDCDQPACDCNDDELVRLSAFLEALCDWLEHRVVALRQVLLGTAPAAMPVALQRLPVFLASLRCHAARVRAPSWLRPILMTSGRVLASPRLARPQKPGRCREWIAGALPSRQKFPPARCRV